jgi:hypothetical protein
MTARTGLPGQDCQNRIAKMGVPGQETVFFTEIPIFSIFDTETVKLTRFWHHRFLNIKNS